MKRIAFVIVFLLSLFVAIAPVRAQDGTPAAGGDFGPPVVVVDNSGEPSAQIWVTDIVDPYEGFDPSSPPDRGFHFVMADITIAAIGAAPVAVNSYGFSLVDTDGFVSQQAYLYRTDTEAVPDLPSDNIEPGQQASGVIFFTVFNGAIPAILDYAPTSDLLVKVADLRDETVAPGSPVAVLDSSGQPLATVTVTEAINPIDDFDPSSPPQRGFSYVGIVVTIENNGSAPFSPQTYSFTLVDKDGFVAYSTYLYRTAEATAALPDLTSTEVPPGGSTSGLVAFSVLNGSEIGTVLFSPDSDRRVRLAEYGDNEHAAVELTPAARPTVAPTATPDPACAEAQAWSDATDPALAGVSNLFELITTAGDTGTADTAVIDTNIQGVEAAIDGLKALDVPDIAQAASDQFIAALEEIRDELENMKNKVEDGDEQGVKDSAAAITATATNISAPGTPYSLLLESCDDI